MIQKYFTEGLLEQYIKDLIFQLVELSTIRLILRAYMTGRGPVCRGEAEIVELKNGSFQIIITSIPFRANKVSLMEKIALLAQRKKLSGIKDFRDESTNEMRIVMDLKSGMLVHKKH
jgi:DNA gyrase/topoisomerase IV subunit A